MIARNGPVGTEVDPAELEDLLAEALSDSESYRALAQQAIQALHDLTIEHDRMLERYHRALDECRRLREAILRDAA